MRGILLWVLVLAAPAAAPPPGPPEGPTETPTEPAEGATEPPTTGAPEPTDKATEPEGAGPRCARGGCARVASFPSFNEQEFSVEGKRIVINYVDGKYLGVSCNEHSVLDSEALPSFPRALRVTSVTLRGCPPPARAFAVALAALNVTLVAAAGGNLTLASLPAAPALAAAHLAGLEPLAGLTLAGAGGARPAPAPGFLAPLRALRSLVMLNVVLPRGELDAPPLGLARLSLRRAGLVRPPRAVLALPGLRDLVLHDDRIDDFTLPPTLRSLSLVSTNTSARAPVALALETLTLGAWSERRPEPLERCGSLRSLQLSAPAAEALPARWVAACARLERLVVMSARLATLPARLLAGAAALEHLVLVRGALESLPPELLDEAPALLTLDLSGNRLQTLPSGVLAGPRALRSLDLSSNRLDARAASALAAQRALESLSLADNPRLGDLCDTGYSLSPLQGLKRLMTLSLRGTNVTRVCGDWRQYLPRLATLDLRNTQISELWVPDLQFSSGADVLLQGAPVAAVRCSRAEYLQALAAPASRATLHLDSALRCDCEMYWARLALGTANGTRVEGLRCADGRALLATPPEELVCPARAQCAGALPAPCACSWRPDAGGPHVLRVLCERAGLRRVPALPAPRAPGAFVYELLLARNDISELRAAHLPPTLKDLDVSNNSISLVDEETAAALGRVPGALRLDGNPLACDCRAAPLLQVMRARAAAARPDGVAECADGRAPAAADAAPCARVPAAAWAAAALAALLAAAAGAAAYLAPPARRVLLKVLLHRWGVLRRAPEPDDGRRFDAFLSFSHEDERVVHELVARLEGGPRPYRLCLHYRDWVPGRWIPDQIVESVAQSRRTLALVSRHFLESTWARAEFREAHARALRDVTPRLVVILLEEPAALPLDAELRRYLATNTYVRWGDPWFWEKLRLALPPPRSKASLGAADTRLATPASA